MQRGFTGGINFTFPQPVHPLAEASAALINTLPSHGALLSFMESLPALHMMMNPLVGLPHGAGAHAAAAMATIRGGYGLGASIPGVVCEHAAGAPAPRVTNPRATRRHTRYALDTSTGRHHSRPDQSYAELAFGAIKAHPNGRVTVQEIYLWIEDHHPFYKHQGAVWWKNCVRHNLATKPYFIQQTDTTSGGAGALVWSIVEGTDQTAAMPQRRRSKTVSRLPKQATHTKPTLPSVALAAAATYARQAAAQVPKANQLGGAPFLFLLLLWSPRSSPA